MSGQRRIIIEINPDGSTTLETKGFQGTACQLASKELELAIAGGAAIDSKNTPEFYAMAGATNQATNRN